MQSLKIYRLVCCNMSVAYGISIAVILTLITTTNGQGDGALQLVIYDSNSKIQTYSSGIVEIYYLRTWGNICYDGSFGYNEANVICHQLAFTGVSSYGSASIYGTDTNPVLLEAVDCSSSSYLVLLQCRYSTVISSYCNDNDHDVFVVCYTTKIWNNPYSGQIRLVGGSYINQGRLEVYCNGQWGTVCNNSFSGTDANVACRQLGYTDYSYISTCGGPSSQPIWLDNVQCTSSSTICLSDCESCPSTEYSNCDHSEDVSLECQFSYSSGNGPYTTLDTCDSGIPIGVIVGIVVVAICICIIVVILIIVCICCCVSVGVGVVAKTTPRSYVVAGGTPSTSYYPAYGHGSPPSYSQIITAYPASRYSPKQPGSYHPQQPSTFPPQQSPKPPGAEQLAGPQQYGTNPQQPGVSSSQQPAAYPPQHSAKPPGAEQPGSQQYGTNPQQPGVSSSQQPAAYPPQQSAKPPGAEQPAGYLQQHGVSSSQQPASYPPQHSAKPPGAGSQQYGTNPQQPGVSSSQQPAAYPPQQSAKPRPPGDAQPSLQQYGTNTQHPGAQYPTIPEVKQSDDADSPV